MNLIPPTQSFVQGIHKLNDARIHPGNLIGVVTPQKLINGVERLYVIFAGWLSIGHLQPFVGVGIIQYESRLEDRWNDGILCPHRSADKRKRGDERGLQEGSSRPVVMG